ncbi:MAG: ubiquinone/menaquinone biosynthesis methyltransferase [Chthoniobacterales bacterium]
MPPSTDIKQLFASIAKRYELANHLLCGGIDIWWRFLAAQKVASWGPRDILDLATGSGDLAAAIKKNLPSSIITGVDFCGEMLEQAKGKNIDHLLEADALKLPFTEKNFDAVTVAFGLRNMESWKDALCEMKRILRNGGHLLILDFSLPSLPIVRPLYRFYLHNILPHLAGWITGKADAYKYMGASIETFPSGLAMCELLEQCGFVEARATPLTLGVVTIYTAKRSLTPMQVT